MGTKNQHSFIKGQSPTIKPIGDAAFNCLFRSYKKEAKKRNYIFELSINEFKNLIFKNCYYCDSIPDSSVIKQQGKNGYKFNGDCIYNGIDRTNNSIGYVNSNCVPCCRICNRAKRELNEDVFMRWILKIVAKHK